MLGLGLHTFCYTCASMARRGQKCSDTLLMVVLLGTYTFALVILALGDRDGFK